MSWATVAQWLVETTWQSAVLVVLVYALQLLLRRRLSPGWRCALWGVVAIRLILPALPSSGVSVYGILAGGSKDRDDAPPVGQRVPQSQIEVHVDTPIAMKSTAAAPTPLPTPAAAPAPVRASASAELSWQAIAIPLWLAVAGLLLARRFAQMIALRRLRRTASPCKLACAVPVLESDRISTPALAGLLRPCILLPQGAVAHLSPAQLALVLDHELVHLRRRDHWAHAAWSVVQALHWFNPFVYFAFSRYRLECELACDQAVLAARREPANRAMYGQMLLDLATGASGPALQPAMAEGTRHLKARLRQIVADSPMREHGSAITGIAVLLLIAGCGLTRAQTSPAPPPQAPPVPVPPATRPTTAPAPADPNDPLERRLPAVRFDGARFEEVVDYLRDATGLNISVNWGRLEDLGATRNSSVQTRLKDISVRKCLDEVCRQLPAPDRYNRPVWIYDQGVITISTTADFPANVVTKVYDVTDITAVYGEDNNDAAVKRLNELPELIMGTVEVASWERSGGYGTIKTWEKNLCLVISQTKDVHTQVESLLNQLRERASLVVDIQVRTIELPLAELPAVMRDTIKQDKSLGWYPSDELLAELLKKARAGKENAVMNAPRMTILNGGTGRVDVWTDVNYVGSVKATTRPSGAPVYEPEINSTRNGLGVTVSPFISHDRKYVRLDIKHEAQRVLSIGQVPYKPVAEAKESFTIQQPVTDQASFEANVSVENGKTICLGERVIASGGAKDEPRVLLLLVTPNIVDVTKLPKPRATTAAAVAK